MLDRWKAKHANGEHSWGVNGDTGKIVDMKTYGLYESASVKVSFFLPLSTLTNQRTAHPSRFKLSKQPSRYVSFLPLTIKASDSPIPSF